MIHHATAQGSVIQCIGGSGFIGSRLVARLRARTHVRVGIIDIAPSKRFPDLVVFGDVRAGDSLRAAIEDGAVLINLAAEHRDDVSPVELYEQTNVEGARQVCQVAREKNVRTIIFTSSVAVYGSAQIDTGEDGCISPFNEYGRTKYLAEQVYRAWQLEAPLDRTLVIIRPTVVFGEGNRGNVFNLLRAVCSGRFVMVGSGNNMKSMAYVENVAAFIEHSLKFLPGIHLYNYTDKPDLTMNELVALVSRIANRGTRVRIRIPFALGLFTGKALDVFARITGRKFAVSEIRIRKFCMNSVYKSSAESSGFTAPEPLESALESTIRHEFISAV